MQKIIPNLWFEHTAEEAVSFYQSIFPDTKINSQQHYPQSEAEGLADFQKDFAGKVLTVDFDISGFRFIAINADSSFRPNPSISFFYTTDSKEESDMLWKKLVDGGVALMELGEYPFSPYYGWVQDKFGFSWQLIVNNPNDGMRSKIIPSLMFTKERDGQAEAAMKFYTSVFKDSEISANLNRYLDNPERADKISYANFRLFDQRFVVMDGGTNHEFSFNPAVSLMVMCHDQTEIDYYWDKLSANREFEQCGWLVDKFGVSWQITPENIYELIGLPGAFKRMMHMKKLDISKLRNA